MRLHSRFRAPLGQGGISLSLSPFTYRRTKGPYTRPHQVGFCRVCIRMGRFAIPNKDPYQTYSGMFKEIQFHVLFSIVIRINLEVEPVHLFIGSTSWFSGSSIFFYFSLSQKTLVLTLNELVPIIFYQFHVRTDQFNQFKYISGPISEPNQPDLWLLQIQNLHILKRDAKSLQI